MPLGTRTASVAVYQDCGRRWAQLGCATTRRVCSLSACMMAAASAVKASLPVSKPRLRQLYNPAWRARSFLATPYHHIKTPSSHVEAFISTKSTIGTKWSLPSWRTSIEPSMKKRNPYCTKYKSLASRAAFSYASTNARAGL